MSQMNDEQQVEEVLEEVPPPEDVNPKEPPHVLLHAPPGEAPNVALVVLSTIAVLAILRWASAFFIPLMLGFVFYYALSPVVEALARAHIPRAAAAAVLIAAILGGSGAAVYSLADDANDLINSLPSAAEKLHKVVREKLGHGDGPLGTVQKAAAELAKAADETNGHGAAAPTPRGVQRVIIEQPKFDIRQHLWTGTVGLVSLVGQITVVTFLTFFLLVSGDSFRRKLVKITGPGFAEKKLTVQALDEINAQIQRYLLVQLLASVGVGMTTGLAFAWLGLEHAAVWGVVAGVLNLVPYVGSILAGVGATLGAFIQTGELELPLLVAAVSVAVNVVEGYLLVPWLTSKASSMNAVSVFIGVLFWGWLWGVWGLLLGIPIMMIIKAVCDRVDQLKPVGELLGA
jgi:predicted PurR-regulated permease PerM